MKNVEYCREEKNNMFDISKIDENFTIETKIDKKDIEFYKNLGFFFIY